MGTFLVFMLVALGIAALCWTGWESRDEEFAQDDRLLFVAIVLTLLAEAILVGILLRALFGPPETLPARFAHILAMIGTARLSLPYVRELLRALVNR